MECERALEELNDLADETEDDELQAAHRKYEHCVAKLNEIAWQIDWLQNPEVYE